MGNDATKRSQAIDSSESMLFDFGRSWWARRSSGGVASPAFVAKNVPTVGGRFIHTVSATSSSSSSSSSKREPFVLLHGYGGGAAMFFAVLPQLAEKWHGDVHALDTPGCGQSSRPPWRQSCTDHKAMEEYMINEIEHWRKSKGIEKMALCGHSVGGYLATCYCEKFPHRVSRLVLASPVGVPETPADWNERVQTFNWKFRFGMYLWGCGFSPFSVVRNAPGSYGKTLVRRYVERRYEEGKPWIDRNLLANYIYTNMSGPQSVGDFCHSALLKPGAWARSPLCHRIPRLKVSGGITFLYGSHDWMGSHHAEKLKSDMRAREKALESDAVVLSEDDATKDAEKMPSDTRVASRDISVRIIRDAGHNLQIDNPTGFVSAILDSVR